MNPYTGRQVPSRPAATLAPFYSYLARCTTRDHRLLILGFVPEVLFFAKRPFAGGQPILIGGYFDSEARQRSIVSTLRRQLVPFVVFPGERVRRQLRQRRVSDGGSLPAGALRDARHVR